jgi:hypothetical protein
MALFLDGTVSDSEDLRAYESGILDVASTEGIELDAKFRLASRDLSIEIAQLFEDENASASLDAVVVTPALLRWHTLRTLALVYRDAYFVQLNDRYEAKWHEYEREAILARNALFDLGVGVAIDPVTQAATPQLDAINGGVQPLHTYFAQTAWISAQGTIGARSTVVSLTVESGKLLRVCPGIAPTNASGWMIWAGMDPDTLALQTRAPLAPNVNWIMPVNGIATAPITRVVEIPPAYFVRRRQLWRRG